MKRLWLLILLPVILVALISVPHTAKASTTGKANHVGYFTNVTDDCGGYVLPGGLNSNNATEFINTIESDLSNSGALRTGAEFIVLTMTGAGTSKSTAHTAATIKQFEDLVRSYDAAGYADWTHPNANYTQNTYYQNGTIPGCSPNGPDPDDVAGYADSGTDTVIAFRNPNTGAYYAIKTKCGNPISTNVLPPLGDRVQVKIVDEATNASNATLNSITGTVTGTGGGAWTNPNSNFPNVALGSHNVGPTSNPGGGYFLDKYTIADNGSVTVTTPNPSPPTAWQPSRAFNAVSGHDYIFTFYYKKAPTTGTMKVCKTSDGTAAGNTAIANVRLQVTAAGGGTSTASCTPVYTINTGNSTQQTLDNAGSPYNIISMVVCDNNIPCVTTAFSPPVAQKSRVINVVTGHAYSVTFRYGVPLNSQCIGISGAPTNATPGQAFTATITMKNTGSPSWSSSQGDSLVDADASGLWGTQNIAMPSSSNYATNSQVQFGISTSAPTTAGTYKFNWIMNRSPNPGQFGEPCTQLITVNAPATPKQGKIYSANFITATGTAVGEFVRDNANLQFRLLSYFWPDAALRSTNNGAPTRHYWEAGLYGKAAGDNGGAGSANADPNNFGSGNLNKSGEASCPSSVACKLPLGYVPQGDSGGNTTPAGNNWYGILKNLYSEYYYDRMGGIASNQAGTTINNVEISNVHVQATGVSAVTRDDNTQGGVGNGLLQKNTENAMQNYNADGSSHFLPGGSQGPRDPNSAGKVAWDNIRNPSNSNSGFSEIINSGTNLEFNNTSGSPANFTDDPENMLSIFDSVKNTRTQQYGTVNAVSLLQDNQDGPDPRQYPNISEPLSYTATLDKANSVNLKWDEYVDWTQKDDKGHYVTTRSGGYTGVDRGPEGTANADIYANYQGYSTTYVQCDPNYHPDQPATYNADGTEKTPFVAAHYGPDCTNNTYNTTCSIPVTWNSGWKTTSPNGLYYYDGSTQSQYGWYNTATNNPGAMPYGGNGGTSTSYFYPSNYPAWANTGTYPYWQPKDITGGSNSGLTDKSAASYDYTQNRWIYNRSDPAYTNRFIYDTSNPVTPSFDTSWDYTTSSGCEYPNGDAGTGAGYVYYVRTDTARGYYPQAKEITESGSSVDTGYGRCVSGCPLGTATFDGASDGTFDNGWAWISNIQNVRYEQTYANHSRDVGARCRVAVGGCEQLYGLDGNGAPIKPDRGVATIYNPTILAQDADIYAGGNIDSYFSSSSNSSAFIFANGSIQNFTSPGSYPNYFNNPSQRTRTVFDDPAAPGSPMRFVFQDYDTKIDAAAIPYSSSALSNLGGHIYSTGPVGSTSGYDLTIGGGACIGGGAGTILVKGDLYITGNMGYCGGTNKANLPSLGVIVTGNVYVSPNVTSIVGTYFVDQAFNTGTNLTVTGTGPNDRTISDPSFTVNGIVVARSFNLQRQLSGYDMKVNGSVPERFVYDGRVVVSPPPGFTYLYTAPAAWNEGIPYTAAH